MVSEGKTRGDKLFELNEWLTLSEAAKCLSKFFEYKMHEESVLKLVIDGLLTLSVRILYSGSIHARRCNCDIDNLKLSLGIKELDIDKTKSTIWGDTILLREGVYDLPMIGAEKNCAIRKWQELTNNPWVEYINFHGTFLLGADGEIYQLQQIDYEKSFRPLSCGKNPTGFDYHLANCLPEDSVLVVRTGALRELEDKIVNKEQKKERQLSKEEKMEVAALHPSSERSLLKIIIALTDHYNFDSKSKKSDVPGKIVNKLIASAVK